jgi:hypothetical protein
MTLTPKRNCFYILLVVLAFFIMRSMSVTAFAAEITSDSDIEEQVSPEVLSNNEVEEPINASSDIEEPTDIDSDFTVNEEPVIVDSEVEEPINIDTDLTVIEEPIVDDSEAEESFDNTSTTEEVSAVDYSEQLDSVLFLLQYITGIMMFFLVVVLCKYVYSFFNIFF